MILDVLLFALFFAGFCYCVSHNHDDELYEPAGVVCLMLMCWAWPLGFAYFIALVLGAAMLLTMVI
jgi:hypothetical protein